ncbi:thioredoxin-disulfide reductase [Pediococcus pentosaceus]|jgi:thioredoxin reductase (NADPH)|uniref:Thioredoxin reductase n=1 Tax=Pediococcus pentosaceus TaxID=1255 RepID=A0ABD7X8J1_PEDPE|nr:thioredoxin-disulfide reductase [Pediococcus pentosaceus]AXR43124.1 thioredoxin-disulfide reductase [Pediococcus pentosaceus]KAF0518907.1 thioredoxin-disulfide reductase [Pediococcus pentosaceus]MBF7111705.1 thioredoxin-disulfide reductase [Pediococcus pentosaceus]MBF7116849.1 thioredoxin-disulfide reductase [Pediococcus pentosaceus]MBF7118590.1 thioredoxin-disulfide reductase [Pediococcus pentosaceus]
MTKQYDVVIIGAGPAGMTAALYASRANLSVVMLDRGIYGGQMNNTADIENFPGFKSVLGPDLSKDMYESSTQFGAEYAYGSVESIRDDGATKLVKTDMGDEFEAKVVIIGTGSEYKKLGVPGEEDFSGRGVSYCAVCDGAFFKGTDVVVVGGGDSAIEEGLYLTQLASKVTVIHRRDQLRAQKIIQDRAFANLKMEFVWNSNVTEVVGEGKVTGVKVNNNQTGEDSFIEAAGVFIYVGVKPMTAAFADLGILDEQGWIPTDDHMHTKVPGILAVGDVRKKDLRQITTAVGDGGVAGQQAYEYIQALND